MATDNSTTSAPAQDKVVFAGMTHEQFVEWFIALPKEKQDLLSNKIYELSRDVGDE